MWSDELQADLSSLEASRIFVWRRLCFVPVVLCVHIWLYVCGFQQTTQHQLSQFPRTSLSPSYLILQELTVCRYHTALQPAGSWINPKMSGRLNHLFGSCWFRRNGVVQMLNFQRSAVLVLAFCVLKNTCCFFFFSHDFGILFCVTVTVPYNSSANGLHSRTRLLCTE